jgi:hypothetical protein
VRFGLRRPGFIGALGCMGAKYLPSIKDQRANKRYHQKQIRLSRPKKGAVVRDSVAQAAVAPETVAQAAVAPAAKSAPKA